MPLEISEVVNSFTSIDGTAGSWMRVAKDNCWIFGGFTIPITGTGQTGGLLRMEFIHCNTGGDIGFGFPFEPLIIGDHYVAATLDSNPETPGLRPALVIGKVKRSEAGFLFKPFLEGVYDPSGKWLRQQSAGVYSQQFDSLTTKIENGQKYYTKSSLSRAQARRLCADPNQKEGVYGMYHTEQSLDLLTVRRLFPPISKNSPYPQWRNP